VQRFAPGVHTPVQRPPAQAWLEQVDWFCQVPVASQSCGVCAEHWRVPGEQLPEQAPPLHTFVQTGSLCQVPVVEQSCGVSPLHCRVPGVQTPVHAPATQA